MNPRLAFAVFVACFVIAAASQSGCYKSGAAPTPSPTPIASISPAPDTLYVQDVSSRTVRVYKNASFVNGAVGPTLTLPTSDNNQPDVVHCSCPSDVLWYPNQATSQIDVWTTVASDNGMNPNFMVPLASMEGAEVYDSNHNYLYVAQNNTNALKIYGSALTLGQGGNTSPIASVSLAFVEPSPIPSRTPHAQEMLYDSVHDRLFVADDSTIVAEFDAFGAGAGASHTANANRQIFGLFEPDGMAYNPSADALFIGEVSQHQIDIIKNASTLDGAAPHTQTISGFTTGPTGLAYDIPRDILFVYDGTVIEVIPNATAAAGALASIPNRRVIFDASATISGFGLYVDTTH